MTAAIVIGIFGLAAVIGGWLVWRWGLKKDAAARTERARAVSGTIVDKGRAAIAAETAKSDQDALETWKRNFGGQP